jgi:hypothetical protein
MKLRNRIDPILLSLLVILLAISTRALGGDGTKNPDKYKDPDQVKDPDKFKDAEKIKEPLEQRTLTSLRPYMDATDAEWDVLLPHLSKAQALTRALRELRDRGKAFDPERSFRFTKEGTGSAPQQTAGSPPPSSIALAAVNEKARLLQTLMQDKSARPADMVAALNAFRASRAEAEKQLQRELAAERAKLKELLTPRQELVCVVSGLLD